jgi:hypothetical protein
VHELPPSPHLAAVGGETHVVPSQHPPQRAGPQAAEATPAPLEQVCLLAQTRQPPESVPHARFDVRGAHAPPSRRQLRHGKETHWHWASRAWFFVWPS